MTGHWKFWQPRERDHARQHANDDQPSDAEQRLDAALAVSHERIKESEVVRERARRVTGNLLEDQITGASRAARRTPRAATEARP